MVQPVLQEHVTTVDVNPATHPTAWELVLKMPCIQIGLVTDTVMMVRMFQLTTDMVGQRAFQSGWTATNSIVTVVTASVVLIRRELAASETIVPS